MGIISQFYQDLDAREEKEEALIGQSSLASQ